MAAYLALMGNINGAIGLTLWALLLVGTIDNFIQPKNDSGLPPSGVGDAFLDEVASSAYLQQALQAMAEEKSR